MIKTKKLGNIEKSYLINLYLVSVGNTSGRYHEVLY